MGEHDFLLQFHDLVRAIAYTQPRTLAMFAVVPLFNPQLVPQLMRTCIAMALGMLAAPPIAASMSVELTTMQLAMLVCKEGFIGFMLGYALAMPFWAFEAIGFIIDNQRGASITATLNPLTGNDSSPLGIMFNQAFIVFFLTSGGFLLLLGVLYDSFRLWPVFDWTPTLKTEHIPLLLAQLDRLLGMTMLLAAPVVVAMFLAELGLALVSRFVPQLQVFFLAMPIKSGLAMIVLLVYLSTLFDLGRDTIADLRKVMPTLQEQWRAEPGARR